MATPNNLYDNQIVLRIGGMEHRTWQSYDIDSDFLIPADGFDFELGVAATQGQIPDLTGQRCEVVINGETVLTGIIGNQRDEKDKGSRSLRLTGRDLACLLVDCSAPQVNVKGMRVLAAVQKLVAPWKSYLPKVVLKAENNPTLDKVDIEPSESAWQALSHVANSVGLHVWLEADGTRAVGGADYSSEPVATLCWSKSDNRRNVERINIERDVDNRFSEVTFLAQSHGRSGNAAKHDLKWVWQDPSMPLHKPKTVVVADADNLEALKRQAKKQLSDWKLEGLTITVTVTSRETHPIYKKQYTVTRKYAAHDEKNDARKGDTVRIIETRPISRRKSFQLDKIVKRSVGSVELKSDVNSEVNDKVDYDHDTEEEK